MSHYKNIKAHYCFKFTIRRQSISMASFFGFLYYFPLNDLFTLNDDVENKEIDTLSDKYITLCFPNLPKSVFTKLLISVGS